MGGRGGRISPNPCVYPSPIELGPSFLPQSSLLSPLPILLALNAQGPFVAYCVVVVEPLLSTASIRRGGGLIFLRDALLTPCCCGGYFLNLLPAVCDEARTQMVGRGTELPHPLRCSASSIGNIQSMRALGGVRWRVFVAYCLMACNGSTAHDVY